MLRPFLILPGLLAAGVFALPPQAPQAAPAAEFKVPADAAGQANPVKSNPESRVIRSDTPFHFDRPALDSIMTP